MISVKAFTLAGLIGSAIAYVVCAAAVAIAPEAITALAGAVIHADLSGITREMTWGIFFGGLAFWAALGAGFFALVGSVYNALRSREVPVQQRVPQQQLA